MNSFQNSVGISAIEWVLCFVAVVSVVRQDRMSRYKWLGALLLTRICFASVLIPLLLLAGHGVESHAAYSLYFFGYWLGFASESILGLVLIYSVFRLAMAPLNGIQELGRLVFRWVGTVSFLLAVALALFPHRDGTAYITSLLTQFQRAQGVMTLCLLVFVCFAIRPLGLTFKSRTFGVILGLGVLATDNLLTSGWLLSFKQLYSILNELNGMATCTALIIWTVYFLVPEPKRSIIVLPTTSPFFRWNQIAHILGDPPGFVAIAGVPPELFADAELEMMRRASLKMNDTVYPASSTLPLEILK